MTFISDGLIHKILDFLGVQIVNADGYYLAFLCGLCVFIVVLILVFTALFKLLVYIKKG